MRKGFIFDHNRCVGCKACSAACILENGWEYHPRQVYCYNSDVNSSLPLVNLSLACNHCEKPVCLEGCPSGSYFRDEVTNAVIIDDSKCIGCSYCQWNCPYDAPKINTEKRVIGKCNLCYTGLAQGRLPACVSGCPTGALSYNEIDEEMNTEFYPWFPDKDLKPGIEFPGKRSSLPLVVIPDNSDEIYESDSKPFLKAQAVLSDWSLVAFSFLTTLSVSLFASSLINGDFHFQMFSVVAVLLAAIFSFFHLGRKLRAWRAFMNIRSSPLSREISILLLYTASSAATLVFDSPALFITASCIGIILLFAIDNVYIYADNSKKIILHGGQTFVSSLLIISFLTGYIVPFIFIAIIKSSYSIYSISVNIKTGLSFALRFFRLFTLLITSAYLFSGQSGMDIVIVLMFLTGELLDRILFYIDFEPKNINNLISNHLIIAGNEKKRG